MMHAPSPAAVQFRNDEITALLRRQAAEPTPPDAPAHEGSAAVRSTCDVAYALFLEPREESDTRASVFEWLTEAVIKRFSPAPVMAHTELLLPPIPDSGGGLTHFATYVGRGGADWQNRHADKEDGIAFYLIANGARWRAVPVFGANAVEAVRVAAQANVGAPYSLGMYPTSAWPMRGMAWMWGDKPMHKGHCATLTARVLKAAGVGSALELPSAWYSPSSLYTALHETVGAPLEASERSGLTSVEPDECARTIDALLSTQEGLSYSTVRTLGDAACIDAVRALTLQVCAAAESRDEAVSRAAQKRLASALLRWVLLRDDGTVGTVAAPPGPSDAV